MKESEKLALRITRREVQGAKIDRALFFKESMRLAHEVNNERIRREEAQVHPPRPPKDEFPREKGLNVSSKKVSCRFLFGILITTNVIATAVYCYYILNLFELVN